MRSTVRDSSPVHARPTRPTLDEIARQKIRDWISRSGAPQAAVAIEVGHTPGWLSRYLAGEFDADLETLLRFTQVFQLPFMALFDEPGDNPAEQKLIADWRSLPPESRAMASDLIALWARPARAQRRRGAGRNR